MKENILKTKIIKKIYQEETKNLSLHLLAWAVFFILSFFFLILVYQTIFEILNEQESLNLIKILTEDFDVFRYYFFTNLISFYQEMPKLLVFILILSAVVLLNLLMLLRKNFNKIKNKIISIYQFYKNKNL
jgi:hypothetical protein